MKCWLSSVVLRVGDCLSPITCDLFGWWDGGQKEWLMGSRAQQHGVDVVRSFLGQRDKAQAGLCFCMWKVLSLSWGIFFLCLFPNQCYRGTLSSPSDMNKYRSWSVGRQCCHGPCMFLSIWAPLAHWYVYILPLEDIVGLTLCVEVPRLRS